MFNKKFTKQIYLLTVFSFLLSACSVSGLYSNPKYFTQLQKIIVDAPVSSETRYFYHSLIKNLKYDSSLSPKMRLEWTLVFLSNTTGKSIFENTNSYWHKLDGTFTLYNDKNKIITSFDISADDAYATSYTLLYSNKQSKVRSIKYLGQALAHQVRQKLLSFFIAKN